MLIQTLENFLAVNENSAGQLSLPPFVLMDHLLSPSRLLLKPTAIVTCNKLVDRLQEGHLKYPSEASEDPDLQASSKYHNKCMLYDISLLQRGADYLYTNNEQAALLPLLCCAFNCPCVHGHRRNRDGICYCHLCCAVMGLACIAFTILCTVGRRVAREGTLFLHPMSLCLSHPHDMDPGQGQHTVAQKRCARGIGRSFLCGAGMRRPVAEVSDKGSACAEAIRREADWAERALQIQEGRAVGYIPQGFWSRPAGLQTKRVLQQRSAAFFLCFIAAGRHAQRSGGGGSADRLHDIMARTQMSVVRKIATDAGLGPA